MSFQAVYQWLVGGPPEPVSAGAAVGSDWGRALVLRLYQCLLPGFHPLLLSRSALLTAGPGEGGLHRLVRPARFLDAVRRKCPLRSGVIDPKCCIIFPAALQRNGQPAVNAGAGLGCHSRFLCSGTTRINLPSHSATGSLRTMETHNTPR